MSSTSRSSRVGFGYGAFGAFHWGWGDFAEIILWNYIPDIYKKEDKKLTDQPFRKWTDAVKRHPQEFRELIHRFPDLRDPNDIPIDLLHFLAGDIGWTDDENRTEDKRRAALYNAWRLYLTKGSEQGYKIIGNFNNAEIEADGLWEVDCDGGTFTYTPPTTFQPMFDTTPLDAFDGMFDDFFTTGGETLLTLRFNGSAGVGDVLLVSVDEVKKTTFVYVDGVKTPDTDTILVDTVDYTVNIAAGTVTLVTPAGADEQYRVTQTVNIPLDYTTTEFGLWPLPVEPVDTRCRTNRVVLTITRIEDTESESPASLSDIVAALEEYKPAHVIFHEIHEEATVPVSFVPTVVVA